MRATDLIAARAEPFDDLGSADLSGLYERIGGARLVLLGEASHGTSEFYRMRARITRDLIERGGFDFVAVEADWPDAAEIDGIWIDESSAVTPIGEEHRTQLEGMPETFPFGL